MRGKKTATKGNLSFERDMRLGFKRAFVNICLVQDSNKGVFKFRFVISQLVLLAVRVVEIVQIVLASRGTSSEKLYVCGYNFMDQIFTKLSGNLSFSTYAKYSEKLTFLTP